LLDNRKIVFVCVFLKISDLIGRDGG
jgi:hypothetical protein